VELVNAISEYLEAMLSIRNVCLIYDMASVYSLTSLLQTCFEFMDQNATEILQSDSFMQLSAVSFYSYMIVHTLTCALLSAVDESRSIS
jgi:BTB/POZ domain-containing protein 9